MHSDRPFRLGVLGSGRGSNFAAVADACATGRIPATVEMVLSDVADAGILDLARQCGVTARHIPPGKYRTRLEEEIEQQYVEALREAAVDLVVLAGYMRVLKSPLLGAFAGRIVNIHPSLLPAFPGLEAWRQALDYGVKITGCTVHFVDAGVDSGAIIGQQSVPVMEGDTPQALHQRIHAAEHQLYPECLAAVAAGRVRIEGRRTLVG